MREDAVAGDVMNEGDPQAVVVQQPDRQCTEKGRWFLGGVRKCLIGMHQSRLMILSLLTNCH